MFCVQTEKISIKKIISHNYAGGESYGKLYSIKFGMVNESEKTNVAAK